MSTAKFVHGAHSADFDQSGIHQMICALQLEMGSTPGSCTPSTDVLFMGGPDLTEVDENALGQHAFERNWNILFASFDVTNPATGPVSIRTVLTDGETRSAIANKGRLWKRDRTSQAIVVFPDSQCFVKVNSKGKLFLKKIDRPYHDYGYELAHHCLTKRAATGPGTAPIMAPIGRFVTVSDIRMLSMMREMA